MNAVVVGSVAATTVSQMEWIMNNRSNDRRDMSRRGVLVCAALAIGAAAASAVSPAAAQQKIGQADAKYQPGPKNNRRCSGCYNFQPPGACKFVQGDISPDGWCQLFVPKT